MIINVISFEKGIIKDSFISHLKFLQYLNILKKENIISEELYNQTKMLIEKSHIGK